MKYQSPFRRTLSTESERESGSIEREFVAEVLEARVLFSAAPVELPEAQEALVDQSGDEAGGGFDSLNDMGGDLAIPAGETEISSNQAVILSSLDNLTAEEIEDLADAAIELWKSAGITDEQAAFLDDIEISVVDLDGMAVGASEGMEVFLDWNAAGRDWFIDQTPFQNEEFEFVQSTTVFRDLDGRAQYGMDLITVMAHEMGHALGLEDVQAGNSIMSSTLDEGVRKVAADGQADGAEAGSIQGTRYLAASGTAGDILVYTATTVGEQLASGESLVHSFDNQVVASANQSQEVANGTDINLTQGHHLVLYNARFDASGQSGAENRMDATSFLTLGGQEMAIGQSTGYARTQSGSDELITSGGGIINVGEATGETLQLVTQRLDDTSNSNANAFLNRTDQTGIQVLKLSDGYDYLLLEDGTSADGTAVDSDTYENVTYNTVNEADSAFTFDSATGNITLNEGGNFLVFANTHFSNAGGRSTFVQQLSLDSAAVAGTQTTVYLRDGQSTDSGAVSLGTMIEASAGQVLNLQVSKAAGGNLNIDAAKSAFTIVRLPAATADTIRLIDSTGQNLNTGNTSNEAAPNTTPVTFDTTVGTTGGSFTHDDTGGGTAPITVNSTNAEDYYLFLHNTYVLNPTGIRIAPNTGLEVTPNGGSASEILEYGQTARYNRDDPANSGNQDNNVSANWGGAFLNLGTGDQVNMVSGALAAGATDPDTPINTVALQGVNLTSVFSSYQITANSGLIAEAGSSEVTLTTSNLGASEASTFTITAIDPTAGTLEINNVPASLNDSFTTADIAAGLVTFVPAGTAASGSFSFTVTDNDTSTQTETGRFQFDLFTPVTDAIDLIAGAKTTIAAGSSILQNAGSGLFVVPKTLTTNNGATVVVERDGSFTYEPNGHIGADSFDYQVSSTGGGFTSGTLNLVVGAPNAQDLSGITDENTTVTIDAFTSILNQTDNLEANPSLVQLQRYGHSVAVDGDLLVVGSDDTGGSSAILVYERNSGSGQWEFIDSIADPDGVNANDEFGFDVAVDEATQTIVVGSFNQDEGGTNSGGIYIFQDGDNNNDWTLSQEFDGNSNRPEGLTNNANLGISVAIDNDDSGNLRIIAGAYLNDTGNLATGTAGSNNGAAYIFKDNSVGTDGSDFQFEQVLSPELADFDNGDRFGRAVEIEGNYAVVLSERDEEGRGGTLTDEGAAYVFERDDTASYATVENGLAGAVVANSGLRFTSVGGVNNDLTISFVAGGALAVDATTTPNHIEVTFVDGVTTADAVRAAVNGDATASTLVTAANFNGDGTGLVTATIAEVQFGQWLLNSKLPNTIATANNDRPIHVGLTTTSGPGGDEARVLIGNSTSDLNGTNAGALMVWHEVTSGNWQLEDILQSEFIAGDDRFGVEADILGDTILVGAFVDDITGEANRGSAFVFEIDDSRASALIFGEANNRSIRVYADDTAAIGNVSINLIDPGANTANTTAVVNGLAIDVTLAHNGTAITATAADVAAAINTLAATLDLTGVGGSATTAITAEVPANNNGLTLGNGTGAITSGMAGSYSMTAHWTQRAHLEPDAGTSLNDRGQFGRGVALTADPGDATNLRFIVGEPLRDTFLPGATETPSGGTPQQVKLGEFGGATVFEGSTTDLTLTALQTVVTPESDSIASTGEDHQTRFTGINEYGLQVDVAGDFAVVGAPGGGGQSLQEGGVIGDNAGDAYIFIRDSKGTADASDDTWTLFQTLQAGSEPGGSDDFGRAVAISADGSTIAIGAPQLDHNNTYTDVGAVYVFTRGEDGTYSQDAYMHFTGQHITDNEDEENQLGFNLDISDDGSRIVAGAHTEEVDVSGNGLKENSVGAVYIFDRPADGDWINRGLNQGDVTVANPGPLDVGQPAGVTRITASDLAAASNFGRDVALSGDGQRLIVGAYNDDTNGGNSGEIYIYDLSNADSSQWAGTETVLPPTGAPPGGGTGSAANDRIGLRLELSGATGEWLVVSADLDDDQGTNAGAVYVYKWDGGSYVLQQKLTAEGTETPLDNAEFGRAVAINETGTLIAVGARVSDVFGTDEGAIYVFALDTTRPLGEQWVLQDGPLRDTSVAESSASDQFGRGLSISGNTVIAGGYNAERTLNTGQEVRNYGSVAVFEVTGQTPTGTVQVQSGGFSAITNTTNGARLSNGSLSVDPDGLIAFDPGTDFQDLEPGESEVLTFTYTLEDTVSGATSQGTATITVRGVNDALTAVDDPSTQPSGYATAEDAVLNNSDAGITGLLANENDPESHGSTITAVNGNAADVGMVVTLASGASLTVNADGTFTYDPTAVAAFNALGVGQTAQETFTYTTTEDTAVNADGNFRVEAFNVVDGFGTANEGANGLTTLAETAALWDQLDTLAESNRTGIQQIVADIYNVDNYYRSSNGTVNFGAAEDFAGDVAFADAFGSNAGLGGDDYSVRATSYLTFNTAGTYTIALGSDDGRRLTLNAVELASGSPFSNGITFGGQTTSTSANSAEFNNTTAHQFITATFEVAAGDVIELEAISFNGTGGQSTELAIATGTEGTTGGQLTNVGNFEVLSDGALTNAVSLSSELISGGNSSSATVTLTVNGANDDPVAVDDAFSVALSSTLSGSAANVFLDNNATTTPDPAPQVSGADQGVDEVDRDIDADPLTVSGVAINEGALGSSGVGTEVQTTLGGSVILNSDGTFTYDPSGGTLGTGGVVVGVGNTVTDSFAYRISDGQGGFDDATVSVDVINIAPPTVQDDNYLGAAGTDEDTVLNVAVGDGLIQGLGTDTEATNPPVTVDIAASQSTSALGATITYNDTGGGVGDGAFSYDPTTSAFLQTLAAGEAVTDTFIYTAVNGEGVPATGTVTVEVSGVGGIEVNTTLTMPDTFNRSRYPGGDAIPDAISVSQSGNNLDIVVNGDTVRSVDLSILGGVTDVTITGSSDDDTVTLGAMSHPNIGNVIVDTSGGTDRVEITGAIDVDGVTITSDAIEIGNAVTTSGDQNYNGATDLTANVVLTGANVTFAGTVDADAQANNRTLGVNVTGAVRFQGDVGGTDRLGSIDTTLGSGTTEIGTGYDTLAGELIWDFDFSANATVGGNTVTDSVGALSTTDNTFELFADGTNPPSIVDVSGTSGLAQIRNAGDLNGGSITNGSDGGFSINQTGAGGTSPGTIASPVNAPDLEASSNGGAATWEFWINPDTLTSVTQTIPGTPNTQVIWETGGGTGTGFFIEPGGNLVMQNIQGGNAPRVEYDLGTDSQSLLSSSGVNEWIQVVGTLDLANETMQLFVNGVLVDNTPNVGVTNTDWDGGDSAALGAIGGSNMGGVGSGTQIGGEQFESFDGQIAAFRLYTGVLTGGALNEAVSAQSDNQVKNNFEWVTTTAVAPNSITVATTGAQDLGDTVLGTSTTIDGVGITFAGTVNGDDIGQTADDLTVNDSATTTFSGIVGGTDSLASLTTNAGGTTAINGGAVTTVFNQTYGDDVTTDGDTNLTSQGDLTVAGTSTFTGATTINVAGDIDLVGDAVFGTGLADIDGNTFETVGSATFNGIADIDTVGVVNAGGNVVFSTTATVDSGATQTYNGTVTLGGTTTLTSSDDVFFNDQVLGSGQDLVMNVADQGVFAADATVGTLTTDTAGSTRFNGAIPITLTLDGSDPSVINDNVVLQSDGTINASGGADVTFNGTINGANNFTVTSTGTTTFNRSIGDGTRLSSLTTGTGAVIFGGLGSAVGGVVEPLLNYVAAEDPDTGDTSWLSTGAQGFEMTLTNNTGFSTVTDSAFTGISGAYSSGAARGQDFGQLPGNPTNNSGTLEIWFRPNSLTGGGQVLWESGGTGVGSSLILDDNILTFVAKDGASQAEVGRVDADITGLEGDFIQAVVVVTVDTSTNPAGPDRVDLYVNGSLAGSDTGLAIGDYIGTDGMGIGRSSTSGSQNNVGGGDGNFIDAGIVTIGDVTVNEADGTATFTATLNTDVYGGFSADVALGAARDTATVADGDISLGTTSVTFVGLAGEQQTITVNITPDGAAESNEEFTVSLTNPTGLTGSNTVDLSDTAQGTINDDDGVLDPRVTVDNVEVSEDGGTMTFTATLANGGAALGAFTVDATITGVTADTSDYEPIAVSGYSSAFPDTSGFTGGETVDNRGTNGWSYLWAAPTDWNGTGPTDASTGGLGVSADYEPLIWNGSNFTSDGDGVNDNGAPGNFANLSQGGGHPGRGSGQDSGVGNTADRAVIAAYTVADAGFYGIANSNITVNNGAGNVDVVVYLNDTLIAGVGADDVSGGSASFDGNLGVALNAGDTIYVAASPDTTNGNDSFSWNFDIVELLSATDPVDPITQQLSFTTGANGEQVQFSVNVVDDGAAESSETVSVALGNLQGVVGVDLSDTAEGTILDNDTAADDAAPALPAGDFDGDIAIMRWYEAAFTGGNVTSSFNHVANGFVVNTFENQTFGGAVTLEQNIEMDASNGTVQFGSTVNAETGATVAAALKATGEVIDIDGAVGSVGALGGMDLSANRIELGADVTVNSETDPTLRGATLLTGNVALTQNGTGNVDFVGTVDSADGNNFDLAVTAANVIFFDDVGNDALVALSDDAGLGNLTVTGAVQVGGTAAVTGGAQAVYDASQDDGLNSTWENISTINAGVDNLTLSDTSGTTMEGAVTHVAVTGSNTNITNAYDFPGDATPPIIGDYQNAANAAHADLANANDRLGAQFNTGIGDVGNTLDAGDGTLDASIELWFKPDAVPPTDRQFLWETGGGTGLGLYLAGNELQLHRIGAVASTQVLTYDLVADPLGLMPAGGSTSDFIQAVATNQVDAQGHTGELKLYVNGTLVATGLGGTDWDGGDAGALGTKGGDNSGGLGGNTLAIPFDGEMAIYRQYNRTILDGGEIMANYASVYSNAPITVTTTGDQTYQSTVALNVDTTLNVGGTDSVAAGIVSGPGGLTKGGGGTLSLNGENTFTGSTTVAAGTMDGSGSLDGGLTIASGATFSSGDNGIGSFSVAGAVDIQGTLSLDLSASNSDQLIIESTGSLNLGDTATITGTVVTSPSGNILAIDNQSLTAITGTTGEFSNVAEGAQVLIGNQLFEADYVDLGTDNNDLVLTPAGIVATNLLQNVTSFGEGTTDEVPLDNNGVGVIAISNASQAPLGLSSTGTETPLNLDGTNRVAQFLIDAAGTPAEQADGFAWSVTLTPTANDLTGRKTIMEIGGNFNGSHLYLENGVPMVLIKQAGADSDVPDFSGGNDTDWAGNVIAVAHSDGAIVPGQPVTITVLFGDSNSDGIEETLQFAVGGTQDNVTLTGTSADNWHGDQSVSVGILGTGGTGTTYVMDGGLDINGGTVIHDVEFYNDFENSSIVANQSLVIATLTLNNAAAGFLTVDSGNGESYTEDGSTGTWKVAGTQTEVNAALAALKFVPLADVADTTIDVSIADVYSSEILSGVINIDVNQSPVFEISNDRVAVDEDSPAQTLTNFVSNIDLAGGTNPTATDESGQAIESITITVVSENNNHEAASLFADGQAPTLVDNVDGTYDLTFTPRLNANGVATVRIAIDDDGAPDSADAVQTFEIVINPVNDNPTINLGSDEVLDDGNLPFPLTSFQDTVERVFAGTQSILITSLPPVTDGILRDADGSALDTEAPDLNNEFLVSELGNLIFTPDTSGGSTWNGTIRFDYRVRNADGTLGEVIAFGTSSANAAPLRGSVTVEVDQGAGPQAIDGFARVSTGDADPGSLSFELSPSDSRLFRVGPTLDLDGTLRFETDPDRSGRSVVSLAFKQGDTVLDRLSWIFQVNQANLPGGGAGSDATQIFSLPSTLEQSLIFDFLGRFQNSVLNGSSDLVLAFSGSGSSFDPDAVLQALMGGSIGGNPPFGSVLIFEDLGSFQETVRRIIDGPGPDIRFFDVDRLVSEVRIPEGERRAPDEVEFESIVPLPEEGETGSEEDIDAESDDQPLDSIPPGEGDQPADGSDEV